ncbi:MAG: hypothetical protein K6G83_04820 [Lachnospiraceae bacterium]|nr:hypothetical protein [Lachnospiraceae bacterium]
MTESEKEETRLRQDGLLAGFVPGFDPETETFGAAGEASDSMEPEKEPFSLRRQQRPSRSTTTFLLEFKRLTERFPM